MEEVVKGVAGAGENCNGDEGEGVIVAAEVEMEMVVVEVVEMVWEKVVGMEEVTVVGDLEAEVDVLVVEMAEEER